MAKRKAAEFDSLPNGTDYLRTNFPADSGLQNATLEPSGEKNWRSDKYGLKLTYDPLRGPWCLRGRDGHSLPSTYDFKTWYVSNQKAFQAPATILDLEVRQRKPAALAVPFSQNVYMHVLNFGRPSDYSYLAGSYYALREQHGERTYCCYSNGLTLCRLPDGGWCLMRKDGGEVAKSVNMATWLLADGRNVDAYCWAIMEPKPKPVMAKESSRSSQPRSEVQAKLSSSSQSSKPSQSQLPKPKPQPQQPQPASTKDKPKRKAVMACNMDEVRTYYHEVHKQELQTPLAVREVREGPQEPGERRSLLRATSW